MNSKLPWSLSIHCRLESISRLQIVKTVQRDSQISTEHDAQCMPRKPCRTWSCSVLSDSKVYQCIALPIEAKFGEVETTSIHVTDHTSSKPGISGMSGDLDPRIFWRQIQVWPEMYLQKKNGPWCSEIRRTMYGLLLLLLAFMKRKDNERMSRSSSQSLQKFAEMLWLSQDKISTLRTVCALSNALIGRFASKGPLWMLCTIR